MGTFSLAEFRGGRRDLALELGLRLHEMLNQTLCGVG